MPQLQIEGEVESSTSVPRIRKMDFTPLKRVNGALGRTGVPGYDTCIHIKGGEVYETLEATKEEALDVTLKEELFDLLAMDRFPEPFDRLLRNCPNPFDTKPSVEIAEDDMFFMYTDRTDESRFDLSFRDDFSTCFEGVKGIDDILRQTCQTSSSEGKRKYRPFRNEDDLVTERLTAKDLFIDAVVGTQENYQYREESKRRKLNACDVIRVNRVPFADLSNTQKDTPLKQPSLMKPQNNLLHSPKWTPKERALLLEAVEKHGTGNWKAILSDSQYNTRFNGRSAAALARKWKRYRKKLNKNLSN